MIKLTKLFQFLNDAIVQTIKLKRGCRDVQGTTLETLNDQIDTEQQGINKLMNEAKDLLLDLNELGHTVLGKEVLVRSILNYHLKDILTFTSLEISSLFDRKLSMN